MSLQSVTSLAALTVYHTQVHAEEPRFQHDNCDPGGIHCRR